MTDPIDAAVPVALRSTFAARQTGKVLWDIRHPEDPERGLICISEEEQTLEDPRTRDFAGVRSVRTYAYKHDIATVVAVRTGEGPLQWVEPVQSSPARPRKIGILRRWPGGNRPPKGSR